MRFGLSAALALSACYSPRLVSGVTCDPNHPACLAGETCQLVAGSFGCVGGTQVDAGGSGDSTTTDGGTCLGSGLFGSICLMSPPAGPVTLSTTINTANVAATTGCTELRPQTDGPSLCIISGTTIDIPAAATVNAVGLLVAGTTVTGANPLVLVATGSITIEGKLNVIAHTGDTIGGALALAAGARTATGCFAAGVDGSPGSQSNGGGGAAGASFGALGAAGGNGGNNNNIGHGNPAATAAPTMLVGGCPGGHGGDGSGGGPGGSNVGGVGGNAGGAVYLLAGDSITIAGQINASGSGGAGGGAGNNSSGGGGGGGAGGMIGLEAGHISVTGSVFANGAGGGGGGGNVGDGSDVGASGTDATAATTAAPGGTASKGGGKGGAGSVGTTAPTVGVNGSGGFPQCGGGGGGGGAGVIRVFGVPASSLTGTISPPAS